MVAPWLHHFHHHPHNSSLGLLSEVEDDNQIDDLTEDAQQTPAVVSSLISELVAEAHSGSLREHKGAFAAFPFTIFAPTNIAFAKIPWKLRLFLLSPFGTRVLRKVLAFHIVPQVLLHTDYVLNATRHSLTDSLPEWFEEEHVGFADKLGIMDGPNGLVDRLDGCTLANPLPGQPWCSPAPREGGHDRLPHRDLPARPPPRKGGPHGGKVESYILPTLLGSGKNESIHVDVFEYKTLFGKGPKTRTLSVGAYGQAPKEYVKAAVSDGVAWGGAVHVVNSFVRPPRGAFHRRLGHNHQPAEEKETSYSKQELEALAYFASL